MSKILTPEQKSRRAETAREWRKKNPLKASEHSKRSRMKNKDKVRAAQNAWVKNNLEHVKAKRKAWYQSRKETVRDLAMKRQFGISLVEYNSLLASQDGACAICGGGPDAAGKTLAVDHCHISGKVRALLCRGCNVGIGNLKDSPELLEKAAKYIRDHR